MVQWRQGSSIRNRTMEYEEECECVELEYSSIPHPACPIHGELNKE